MAVISNINMLELLDEDTKNSGTVKDAAPELFDKSGRLLISGRFDTEPPLFERKALPAVRRCTRLKETDSFTVMSDKLFLYISAGDLGSAGYVSITAVNRQTGYHKNRVRVFPFTFGSMEMPSSPSHGDFMLRRRDVSLDFARSPAARYIRCRFEDFDDVRALYINLELRLPRELENGWTGSVPVRNESGPIRKESVPIKNGVYYSLRPNSELSGGFRYSAYIPCMPTTGTVVIGADRFEFSEGSCFTSYEWSRAVQPRRASGIILTACGGTSGNLLGISASSDGTMVHDSGHTTVSEPSEILLSVSDPMRPADINSPDGSLEMTFKPLYVVNETINFAGLLKYSGQLIFGTASGTCRTDPSGKVSFSEVYARALRYTARW